MQSNTNAGPCLPVSERFLIEVDESTFNLAVRGIDEQFNTEVRPKDWQRKIIPYYQAMRRQCHRYVNWIDKSSPETKKVWEMTCKSGQDGKLRRETRICYNCEAFNFDWHPRSSANPRSAFHILGQ